MTHKDSISQALLAGRMLSKQEILRDYKCWNSGDAILKLRRELPKGYTIETMMTGKPRHAKYYMTGPGIRRIF